jgi:predicted dehydrogenase
MRPVLGIAILVSALCVSAAHVRPGAQEAAAPAWATRELRAGIIGTDTSHVPAFAKTLKGRPEWKVRLVAAFKGGSPDLPTSANRVEGFARTIREEYGVELVDSIEALLAKVDVVLLTSVDGRPHLAQVTPVLKARKPVFVDKPLAASLEDARRIVALAKETGTPFFSSSSSRFHADIPRLRDNSGVGKVTRVQATYTLNKIEFHPDLYFYGIHGVEALYAVMGTGCAKLTRRIEVDADVTTCTWSDGRVGVYHGTLKGAAPQPLIRIWGEKGTTQASGPGGYDGLVQAIAEFFQTGRAPVDVAQTLEIFEFMTAADLSKARNGAEVQLAELRK